MTDLGVARLSELDWPALGEELDRWGFAVTPPLLDEEQCRELSDLFEVDEAFRSTIVMSRHAFGEGTYRYFADPLPDGRAAAAGGAVRAVGADRQRVGGSARRERLTPTRSTASSRCARRPGSTGRHRCCCATGPSGYNCLHQDLYGEVAFPLQVTIMLSVPDEDFTGGENVLVEQRPRARSPVRWWRAPRPGPGAALPDERPARAGKRGPKRVAMRHGVSTVHSGERTTLGIIFHNAE